MLKEKAVFFDIGGVNVPVISIPDLIAVKAQSDRKQDLADVDHLKTLLKNYE